MHYKIKGNPNLIRDKNTNAILSVNSIEYEQYKKLKQSRQNEDFRIETLESEMNLIKNDLNDIKNLLLEFKNAAR